MRYIINFAHVHIVISIKINLFTEVSDELANGKIAEVKLPEDEVVEGVEAKVSKVKVGDNKVADARVNNVIRIPSV